MKPATPGLLTQAACWGGYGVLHYLSRLPAITADERPVIALASAVLALTGWACGALVIVSIAWAGRRSRYEWAAGFLAAGGAALAWMFVDRAALVAIAGFLRLAIPWERYPRGLDLEYVFVMLAWTASVLAIRARDRQRILAEQVLVERLAARDARLAAIGSRLQPHFLFNALNTARSLAAEDVTRARELLTRIAGFLRYSLDVDADSPVTLAEEVEAVRSYLAIEQARFEDALRIEIQVDRGADDVLLPPFVLQPLVENAVRYAEPDAAGRRWIRVLASADDTRLEIVVQNPGRVEGAPRDASGLAIARARLEHLYRDRQRLELGDAGGVVSARLVVDAPARAGDAT